MSERVDGPAEVVNERERPYSGTPVPGGRLMLDGKGRPNAVSLNSYVSEPFRRCLLPTMLLAPLLILVFQLLSSTPSGIIAGTAAALVLVGAVLMGLEYGERLDQRRKDEILDRAKAEFDRQQSGVTHAGR